MFVANGQKFILLPATCLHQVLPHTPQHQSYRFFIKHPTSTCFTAICGTPELPCAVKTLAHYWQNLCVNDILHILQFGTKFVCPSPYKYLVRDPKNNLRHEKISHWGKYVPRIFYVCFLAFCGTCSVLELEPFANMVLHGIGSGKHSFACFVSILGAFS